MLYSPLYAQHLIKGKVIDSKSKEPLAFAPLIFNNNSHLGVTTDIDGQFSFNTPENIRTLTCSYTGYKPLYLQLDSVPAKNNMVLRLEAISIPLQEVTIHAGENPANRIIRRVIENKANNNPEKLSSFKYTCYNKTTYDFKAPDTTSTDSAFIKMQQIFKGGHLFIMESVSERKYLAPGYSEEVLLATKVSGFKRPSFGVLATDIQPFSFYEDIIKMLDINYINPISRGSLNKYFFQIRDTLYQNQDTVFIISFKPLKGKTFDGLKGLLYINTNGYAIQNVIAEPDEKGFIDIKIQQLYSCIDNKYWFPKQLNFEIIMLKYPSKRMMACANGKSYLDSIELFPKLQKSDFSAIAMNVHEKVNDRDSLFWDNHRNEQLSTREQTTYHFLDSVGEKNNADKLLKFIEKVSINRIPMGYIDLNLSYLLINNKYEGFRPGLGFFTNERVLKHVSLGGFFGYGIKDQVWKYGGALELTLSKKKEIVIKGLYQNSYTEVGKSDIKFFGKIPYDARSFMGFRMDRLDQKNASIAFRAFKYMQVNLGVDHRVVTPLYDYVFISQESTPYTNYTNSAFTCKLRYAFQEKLIESFQQIIRTRTKYPVFVLSYSKGIKGLYGSHFDYNKVELGIEKEFVFKNLGTSRIKLEAGYIDSPLPYGLLFTGEGAFDKNMPIIIPGYFQTVSPYEFLSDQYAHLHFSHNLGSLLFKKGNFRPLFTLQQSIGFGKLSNPSAHEFIVFKTKERGLFESGLKIDNLIKLNYMNLAYIGVGCGVYYRYGSYASNQPKNNLNLKLSFTYSTK